MAVDKGAAAHRPAYPGRLFPHSGGTGSQRPRAPTGKEDVDLASRGDMPETYTTRNGVTYHSGDAIDSHTGDEDPIIRLVIDHVDEQHVWYTVPDKPDEGMREMSRLLFETYLNTGVFQHAPTPEVEKEAGLGPSPTVRELYEHYKPAVIDLVLADEPYRNACRNSDKENALLEGAEAIKRAALQINDPQFMRLYYDLTSFHNNLHREVLDETYPMLAEAPQAEASEMLTPALSSSAPATRWRRPTAWAISCFWRTLSTALPTCRMDVWSCWTLRWPIPSIGRRRGKTLNGRCGGTSATARSPNISLQTWSNTTKTCGKC